MNMMRIARPLLALALLLVPMAAPIGAAETTVSGADKDGIATAADAEIPLLVLASSRRTKAANQPMPSEAAERLLNYLASEAGLRFRLQPVPWNRAMMMAMRGEAGIYGLSRTAEREQLLDFSERVYSEEVLLVTRHDQVFDFHRIEDLRGKRVGVQLGSSYDDAFEHGKNRLFIADENANGATARMRQLLVGRIDVAVYGNGRARLERLLAKAPNGGKEFAILAEPLTRNERYFAFPKQAKAGAILQRLNAAIARGVKNGQIDAILAPAEAADSEPQTELKP